MASAHLSARPRPISRSCGESSTAAAAYRARCELADERTGQAHDYSQKARDVLFSGMYAPDKAPAWTQDRAAFWNQVEAREKRKDSQLAREFTIALPHELTTEQNRRLVQDFVRENFVRRGYVADVNIHRPHPWGDQRNVHAHIMVPLRRFEGREWSKDKDHFINGKPDVAELKRLRDQWEKLHNKAMERYGHEARISMKKLAEQGIDREPEIHLGKAAGGMHRRGIETERGEQLRDIRTRNLARKMVDEMEPARILTTLDRMRLDEDERRRSGGLSPGRDVPGAGVIPVQTRELLAAVRSLAATMGGELAIVFGIDPADLARRSGRVPAAPQPTLRPAGDRRPLPLRPEPLPALTPQPQQPARTAEPVRPFIPPERPAARIMPPAQQPAAEIQPAFQIRPPTTDPQRTAPTNHPARSNDNDSRPAAGRANDDKPARAETLKEQIARERKERGDTTRAVYEQKGRGMSRELGRPGRQRERDEPD